MATIQTHASVDIQSPLLIPDCALWLDASDASTINAGSPSDGDPVSAWADKSGNEYDAVQAITESKPVFKTAIQNTLSIVRFDAGGPNFLEIAPTGLFQNYPGLTIAVCAGMTGGGAVIYASTHDTTDTIRVDFGSVYEFDVTGSDTDASSVSLSLATAQVLPAVGYWTAGELMGLGAAYGVVAHNAGPSTGLANTTPGVIQIGQDADAGQLGALGADLAEIIVYARALDQRERRQLLEYLSAKWGTI